MLYPTRRDEFIRNPLDLAGLASHREHFHAVVMVQVHVQSGYYQMMVIMLNLGQRVLHV